ncbi:hypothetical protein B0T20DRAFT_268709 [Sordaria brevicollis]|uniref:MADS-box MEF2 type transcription factor MIG1 n=1 Tax=Sordaria brevicollis TaxID=83679 RepID=A0AAE0PB43_SORBR|nr:hypothetical protein B0T20DRAFT_268709 [Sordaria brevicollis]
MGRRKIEIKAIKDDRNRSVTFLKRKGGLFKKAHELSVLCSVDVAVIIFGNNKKLYEYSSGNIREILQRYTYHGGPNEHKGPQDFNGGADDDDDDDENGTNSQGEQQHMIYQPNPPAPFPYIRHTSLSDSPPVPNGAFGPQPGHQMSRAHTPQPPFVIARPPSVNDIRRLRPGQPVGPVGVAQELQNRSAFVPSPPIYNPQPPATMAPTHGLPSQLHPQYPFQPSQPPAHPMQQFEDQRRSPLPPTFVSQPPPPPAQRPHSTSPPELLQPPMTQQQAHRHSASPQVHQAQLPQQPPRIPSANMSPPPPQPAQPPQQHQHQYQQPNHLLSNQNLQPPAPPKPEDRPRRLIPTLNTSVKNHGQGSVFTPIEPENKSILSQHFAAFRPEIKSESPNNRSQSLDGGSMSKPNTSTPSIQLSSANGQGTTHRTNSLTAISQSTLPPPSRPPHLRVGGGGPLRPRLKVQIPDDSDSGSAAGSASSPRVTTTTDSAAPQPLKTGPVLPPPSPSASNLPSAGATGPPNPFAPRSTVQHNNMHIDTPVSALPSRFLGDLLPSPSRFYPAEWGYGIGGESNTLPSPLNFATPVNGTGPSFLRDDPTPLKRKSPETKSTGADNDSGSNHDAKRMRHDS